MPFGHKAAPIRAYAYHAVLVHGAPAIRDELRRRALLWNQLVPLDHELRERKEVIADTFLGITQDEHDARREQLAALWKAGTEESRDGAKALQTAIDQARKPAWKDPGVKAQLKALDKEAYERSKALMYCVLDGTRCPWWGNSNAVRAAWDGARRFKAGIPPEPTRYHRSADEDKLDIQLIGGRMVDALVAGEGGDRGGVEMAAWDPEQRQKHAQTPLRLRVGPDAEGDAAWTDWLVCFHRPLPAGGKVQQVQIKRDRRADQTYWTIIFLVAMPPAPVALHPRPGIVALDLGWRRVKDGLRVALWRGDDGQTGELLLDNGWLAERSKVDNLQSIRDQNFNDVRTALVAWRKWQLDTLPDWWREATASLWQWKQPRRLAALWRRWGRERLPDDDAIYAMVTTWAHRDRHLWQYQEHLRDQLQARRREQYRVLAAQLAHRYGRIVLEEVDWGNLALRKWRGEPATDPVEQRNRAVEDATRKRRQWAAVSTLELAIESAAKREGSIVSRVACPYTTALCAICDSRERWDHIELFHTCSQCRNKWEQDENTVRVLMG